jgi:hypothetical protein
VKRQTRSQDQPVELNPCLALVEDHERDVTIVLNETLGRYSELSGAAVRVFRHLRSHDGPHSPSEIAEAMADMGEGSRDSMQQAVAGLLRAEIVVPVSAGDQPPVGLVIEYSLLNLWYSFRLRRKGWAPIWSVRARQIVTQPSPSAPAGPRPPIADVVIAAARRAACLPWVHPQCTVVALSVHRLLARRGYAPELVVVAEVHPFNSHIWVELGGHVIDPAGAQGSMARFSPVRPQGAS